ncbi:tRNA1(Val) (adenine(37)-N6)-methyltransferase [Lentibacillus halophilus]|uniref:tRNA1(Val) (Adenine(37)-N6)-methyltransferase n=1 Tax=Lentibacillus halophilus TaxID=295065 RepID=A0ABN0Z9E0_9BACI
MKTINDDERLDYLLSEKDMHIIQSSHVFSFSLDAVLLAHFAYVPIKKGHILDLCTGNGVIPLLLSRRTNASIVGVEIQSRLADMAKRSVALNQLGDRLTMIHGDLKEMKTELGHSAFDVVTCNPPYFPTPAVTEHNENVHMTVAKHEVYCTLDDVVKACKLHVRPGGKVAMVHRPDRLVDIIVSFRQYRIEPKRVRFIYPKYGREANMLLVEGTRDGNAGLTMLPPLYIYHADNTYTKEAEGIIYGK